MSRSVAPAPRLKRPGGNNVALEGDLLEALSEEQDVMPVQPHPQGVASESGVGKGQSGAIDAAHERLSVNRAHTDEIIIVSRKEAAQKSEDDIEARLAALDSFLPLLPPSTPSQSNFTLMSMLGVTSASSTKPQNEVLPVTLDSEPYEALFARVQAHIKACSDVVTNDQLLLSDLVREVDDYCLKLAATMQQRKNVVHAHTDGLVVLQNIRQHVDKTKATMRDIFRTLSRLEPILDSEERIKTCADRESYSKLLEVLNEAERRGE